MLRVTLQSLKFFFWIRLHPISPQASDYKVLMHYTGFNLGLKFPGVSYVHKQKIPTLENQDRFMVPESKIKSWELFLCPVRNSIIGLEEIDKSFQFPKALFC